MPVSATQDCPRRKIQDLIDHPAEHGIGFCILCGRRSEIVGIFEGSPEDRKRLGEPDGKLRLIGYGLCRACSLEPEIAELVESKIFRLKSVC